MAATGTIDDPVITSTVGLATGTLALSAVLAVSAALIGRDRHGMGDHFDLAAYDSLLTHLGTLLPSAVLSGKPPPRRGNRHAMAAPWNTYECTDRCVMVCTMGDAMWSRFTKAMGRPHLREDPRFGTATDRVVHVDALDAAIEEWTRTLPASEVLGSLRAANVACAPVSELGGQSAETADRPLGRDLRQSLTPRRFAIKPRTRQGALWGRADPQDGPLSGMRVLELGAYTAAPMAGWLLSHLGATVLKVEPAHGEGARRLAQKIADVGYLYFINNAGKRGIRLNLDTYSDRVRFDRLLADADTVLTNLAEDTLRSLKLDADTVLSSLDVVHCMISGSGSGEPGRAFDTVIQAESGMMAAAGASIGEPRKVAVSAADVLGAYAAAAATTLATLQRLRHSGGYSADVALRGVAAWAVRNAAPDSAPRVLEHPELARICDGEASEPLWSLTDVLSDPQAAARQMLVEQEYEGTRFIITGNHLRSLRRPLQPDAVAPVEPNVTDWPPNKPRPLKKGIE